LVFFFLSLWKSDLNRILRKEDASDVRRQSKMV
jgi:hypothetical protein